MREYEYRCSNNRDHTIELLYKFGEYPSTLPCYEPECNGEMFRIITQTYFSVDNTDRTDWSPQTGRQFRNKWELQAWMDERGAHVLDKSEWAPEFEAAAAEAELRNEVAARGENWGEFATDRANRIKRDKIENLRKKGIKISAVTADEFQGATPEKGWESVGDEDLRGEPTYRKNKDGKMIHTGWQGKPVSESRRKATKEKFDKVVTAKDYSAFTGVAK